jgi:hypothetical protein
MLPLPSAFSSSRPIPRSGDSLHTRNEINRVPAKQRSPMKKLSTLLFAIVLACLCAASAKADLVKLPSTPVNFYADGGDTASFFDVTLFNVPAGFSVENALYVGWCVSIFDPTSPTGLNHTALLYDSTSSSLPIPFNTKRWNLVNYILNHKEGIADEVQSAIWLITDGISILPVTANVEAMVADALANGNGFLPHAGQIDAVIVRATDDLSVQTIIIEVPTPGQPPPPCMDRVTGGGFIFTHTGAFANFGVEGGVLNGKFWGGLNYIDHGTGLHVKSRTVINYETLGPVTRRITYIGTANGAPVTIVVIVTDNGEPGTNDVFQIAISNGYAEGAQLGASSKKKGGGNIQLHKAHCGNGK